MESSSTLDYESNFESRNKSKFESKCRSIFIFIFDVSD